MRKRFLSAIILMVFLFNTISVYASEPGDGVKQYIIVLETPPIAEQSRGGISLMTVGEAAVEESEIEIAEEQEFIIEQISDINTEEINIVEQLDTVLNCIIIESEELDIDEISRLPGVKSVYEDQPITLSPVEPEPKETYSVVESGVTSPYVVDGIKGEKMLIAIIDAGFDVEHEAFAISDNTEVRFSEETARSLISEKGLTGVVYKSEKIPYYKKSGTTSTSHGTHVAGIIGGNNKKIQGAAPEAQLMLIETANANGTIYSGPIVAGIEDAVKMGADCINLSIGSPSTFPDDNSVIKENVQTAIANANSAGITVCHSAGNDGRNMYNGTYDSYKGNGEHTNILFTKNPDYKRSGEFAADAELTVGALESADFSYVSLDVEGCSMYMPVFMSNICTEWEISEKFNILARRTEGLNIVNCGDGTGEFPATVSGHIALIKRKDTQIMFTTLAQNAFNAGAVGVLFAEDYPSTHQKYNMVLCPAIMPDSTESNFVAGTATIIADYIVSAMGENGVAQINSARLYYDNKPSSFSSWGVTNDLKLVPSISAYGVGIYSSVPGNDYAKNSGTSMSSPYVAACVALVRQGLGTAYSAEEANRITKNLLMATADMPRQPETGNIYTSGVYHSPRQVGLGNVNPQAALDAQCMVLGSSGLPKLDLKEISGDTIAFSLSLENITSADATYVVSCETMTDGYGILSGVPEYVIKDEMRSLQNTFSLTESEYVTENTVTVPAYSTVNISGEIKLNGDELNEISQFFVNGFFVDGIIDFEAQTSDDLVSSDLHCAIMGFYGDWDNPPMIDPYIGTSGSYYNRTSLYRSNGAMAGVNSAEKNVILDLNKLCVGENFRFDFIPMRNIKSVIVLIDGNKVLSSAPYWSFPNYKYTVNGPTVKSLDQSVTKYSTEGEHTFGFATKTSYGSTYQLYQIPFITDLTPPSANASYVFDGENINIDVTASDNFYLQYLDTGSEKIVLENEKGGTTTAQLSMPKSDTDITINVYDYADNVMPLVVSTVIKDSDGNTYTSLKAAVEAAAAGNTTLTVSNYCEELSETVVIPADKHITIEGSAQFSKDDSLKMPSVKVLGSLTYDDTVIGLEVSVIPEVEGIHAENGEISLILSSVANNPFASVFAASYDGNGALLDCVKMQCETSNPAEVLKSGAVYKVFVWDTLSLMPYRYVAE